MIQDTYSTSQPEPQPPADEWVPASRWPSLATVVGWVVRIGGLLLLAAILAYFIWMVHDLNQQVMQLQTDMNAAATSQASVPTSVAATATSVAQQLASILLARQNPDQPVEEGSGPIEVSVNLLDQNGSPYAGDKRLTAEVPDGVLSAPGSPESGRRIRFNVSQGVGTLLFTPGQAGLVTITVSDEGNPAMQGTIEIEVASRPGIITGLSLTIDPPDPQTGDTVTFHVDAQTDNGNPPVDGTMVRLEMDPPNETPVPDVILYGGMGKATWEMPSGTTPIVTFTASTLPPTVVRSDSIAIPIHSQSACSQEDLLYVYRFKPENDPGRIYEANSAYGTAFVVEVPGEVDLFSNDESIANNYNEVVVLVWVMTSFVSFSEGEKANLIDTMSSQQGKVLTEDPTTDPGLEVSFGEEANGLEVQVVCTTGDYSLIRITGKVDGKTVSRQ